MWSDTRVTVHDLTQSCPNRCISINIHDLFRRDTDYSDDDGQSVTCLLKMVLEDGDFHFIVPARADTAHDWLFSAIRAKCAVCMSRD